MNAADLFVKSLENEGVKYIFGVPGEENLRLLESIRKSSIRFIVTRHEQAAGFMAATIGRLTGQAGVCLSTLGPGSTNFVTAVAYAQLGGMPALFITGQKPVLKSKQGHFQIINTVGMMSPITKFSKQIIHGQGIPYTTRFTFKTAEEERPGAVHLELPEDIADEEVNEELVEVTKIRRPVAEEKAVVQAVAMIQSAKRPLLLIGAGANRKRTSNTLLKLIEKTGIPFFNTQMGKGVIDERHALYLGTAALSENDYLHCAIDRADLIINVGHDTIEKPPFIMRQGDSRKVIHVNFSSATIDQIYFPHLEVVGDIANSIWQMSEKIEVRQAWDFSYFMKIKKMLSEHIQELAAKKTFPYSPAQFVAEVRDVLSKDDDMLMLDNGMYKIWFARNYPAYAPNTLLLDNALASMGTGLPSAIAAKILYPDRRVVALCGDGGFMMSPQDLETAVRLKLDLVIIVLRDDAYGMIKWKQAAMNLEDFSLDFGNPDFVKFAESFGAKGKRVEKIDDLGRIMNEAFAEKGVCLIDVPVDYKDNKEVLIDQLKNRTCEL